MKKLKILVDARCVGGEGQGMLTYLVGLYQSFYRNYSESYELYFAGYHKEALLEYFPFMEDAHFIQLPEKAGKFQLFYKVFPDTVEKYVIDYAHYQYVTPFRKKCKQIVTTHDVLFLDFPESFSLAYRLKRKFLFKRSLQQSDIRLTVSNYSKNRIAELLRIPANSIHISPNAVQEKYLETFDKKEIQQLIHQKYGFNNYILYVSRIEKRKNHLLLLKAYEDLRLYEKGIPLVFVGNDTLGEAEIVQTIQQAQIRTQGAVHWLPQVHEEDLLNLYKGARLFVYPSLAEGFGIPPIEAAALGVETLCSNKTAMQDFSFFGNNLFDPDQYPAFKAALSQSIDQPARPSVLKNIREHIADHYSWDRSAHLLNHLIQDSKPKHSYQKAKETYQK
jgi:glycosyltransferase involved in cell wall biosynthesis